MSNEKIENTIFDLLEAKDFQELNSDERAIVATLLSEEDYNMQRRIITETKSEGVVPGPLVLPSEKRMIPIWFASACSAAAAAILVFLLIPPSDSLEVELNSVVAPMEQDTLIVQNTVIDTIVDYRYVTIENDACCPENLSEDLRQIPDYPNGQAVVLPIRTNDLANGGVSAANDAVVETFRARPFIGM